MNKHHAFLLGIFAFAALSVGYLQMQSRQASLSPTEIVEDCTDDTGTTTDDGVIEPQSTSLLGSLMPSKKEKPKPRNCSTRLGVPCGPNNVGDVQVGGQSCGICELLADGNYGWVSYNSRTEPRCQLDLYDGDACKKEGQTYYVSGGWCWVCEKDKFGKLIWGHWGDYQNCGIPIGKQ